ncbi:membrane protein : ABC-type transport system, involved in lipoprotein release, permease component OS=Singulisphaera acidiphila (strain ATCC BAA-1392 / DSM 18658 / VKM B-2454 / MOB10) GN=Sinac_5022 PE=4 SV=1: MacB_PCD: FtsX [Gemmataceae bacterium]|nr:membrane protein : ABC-type transport system, involved in lipoprotein release, permease component OS=Singulisphaera acidiphila (strain ATCC BAA-1392 / DSM 18658 / VKM B-2454 / MOB10) GN=Sinac_5022 PE=4 SV=1: MacB_PCD: FtsX [Gemmataceae bacterium]VTU01856.1 membrane protein : ABC-type transport system, involved in lipoprotein release, permease component OS=Singulisphaera acidiphila (strain ATCC BAA-1392 / DSM 18658 / VKM B-2454 / MOB10) GN=Sinac_5022 PE=4 SV=1: MacB_PCD: FtsX [Gemmataceae bacter
MYKLLLCVRYLQTRYLAFICIVSVMLGVATLIVVNAVMSGFSTKLKDRLHGVLSDVIVDTDRSDGFEINDTLGKALTPDEVVARIMASPAGPKIAAVTPTIEVFAILQFNFRGQAMTKPVRLIGIDPEGRAAVGGFAEYLVRQHGHARPSFELTPEALKQHELNRQRRERADALQVPNVPDPKPLVPDPAALPEPDDAVMKRDMPVTKLNGAVIGYTIAHFRWRNEQGEVVEEAALKPGDDVTLFTAGGSQIDGGRIRPVFGNFLVTDYLKTEMSEYDQSFVYVPLDVLQRLRTMEGRCTAFQIKLKNYEADKKDVVDALRGIFDPRTGARVATWEEHQGSLLAAIDVERGILNLLLFMIVGVAGFSILAIFTMIVSEKYRDIGILKSLGASNHGVMSIFVCYGLLLGTVGCGLGTALGLTITDNINEIEMFLTRVTGKAVFPRDVYYFKDIPTNVDMVNVAVVNIGAVAVATLFSLLPAWRAARLHPVRALRFE